VKLHKMPQDSEMKCLGGTRLSGETRLQENGATGGTTVGVGGGGHATPHSGPCPRVVSTAFMPETAGCLFDVFSVPVSERSVPVG